MINISLASFPGLCHADAAILAHQGLSEPYLGVLSSSHIQLVPQSFGLLDEEIVESLNAAFELTRFRLHANVRVLDEYRVADFSNFKDESQWFHQAAKISKMLGSIAYSAHSGRRANATMSDMFDNVRRAQDLFEVPVAVEGLYPTKSDEYLVSTWQEYQQVFESGLFYALDLSHLNILSHRSRMSNDSLIQEMLQSERCLEVHVSSNDGLGDQHAITTGDEFWMPLLPMIHPNAVIFSEGNHRRKDSSRSPTGIEKGATRNVWVITKHS